MEITEEEFLELKNIPTPIQFESGVESLMKKCGIESVIDGVLEYCTENEIEIEIVGKLITNELRDKLFYEAKSLNFLPNDGMLPI
tara:strand:- start:1845 stop:2099 length:255 start_codon:yes stop_codon:yes gene_type:complete